MIVCEKHISKAMKHTYAHGFVPVQSDSLGIVVVVFLKKKFLKSSDLGPITVFFKKILFALGFT